MNTINILGINFFKGNVKNVFDFLNQNGGLMTVPAAPALVTINNDLDYLKSLHKSDIVIPDSGYMVLLWNILSKHKINKISGLAFVNLFIKQGATINEEGLFLINPSIQDGVSNVTYLQQQGFNLTEGNSYLAPFYNGLVEDEGLIKILEKQKPRWILINIGGGTQEKLGLYIKEKLSYKPSIMCTGAAIAFKTGRQANIPNWMDRLYLGWLSRCLSNPKMYIPRYLKGFKLLILILKFKLKK